MPSISAFIFVQHILNQFVGKSGKLSCTLAVQIESLYYNGALGKYAKDHA